MNELASQRGRRGKDNRQLLRELEALYRLSVQFGPRVEIPVVMHVISAQFGLQRTLDDYMDTPVWKACSFYLERVAGVLEDGYRLAPEEADTDPALLAAASVTKDKKMAAAAKASAELGAMDAVAADEKLVNPHTGEPETEDERAERLRVEKEESLTEEERKTIHVVGSLSLHLTRLEEEYTKSLREVSHHSPDYVSRLRDESVLVDLLSRFQSYFEKQEMIDEAAALAQLRIEHLYYRHDHIAAQVDKAALFSKKYGDMSMLHPACSLSDDAPTGELDFAKVHPASFGGKPSVDESVVNTDYAETMADLCSFVYTSGTDAAKTRAIICQIYHHAVHDRFLEARDLLLMSHLQENIYSSGDLSTMVLFNRMMVNLGMCAFRSGRIYDAHQCLAEICSGRVRELLAQGVSTGRFSDKSPDQEKAEKRRQVPYHQHINMDLLEACHLISAMLLEVPNMAAVVDDSGSSRRTRIVSRTFRKFHDQYNHQVFTGPPEQTRDFVMRASKALMSGDWKTCSDLVSNLDVWNLVPGEGAPARIGTMLKEKIKVEGLRTYLFAFSAQYESLSMSQLCGMFDMTKNEVHSVVSKMMINRELYASWDQPTETIVLRKVEPTSLQIMALQYAEKAASLVEANERLLDAQSGNYGYDGDKRFDDDGDRRFRRGDGQRDNNRRGQRDNRSSGHRDGRKGHRDNRGGNRQGGRGRGGNRGRRY